MLLSLYNAQLGMCRLKHILAFIFKGSLRLGIVELYQGRQLGHLTAMGD